jgi:CRISPR/Cas system-associated exonuclease Cas4 (RecB family)
MYKRLIKVEVVYPAEEVDDRLRLEVRSAGGEGELIVSPWWRESALLAGEGVKLVLIRPEGSGKSLFLDERGMLVIEPEQLVEPTGIAGFAYCPLIPFLRAQFPIPVDYRQILGQLVHLLFSKLVLSEEKLNLAKEARKIVSREKDQLFEQFPRLPSIDGLVLDTISTIEPVISWVTEIKERYGAFKRGVDFHLSSSILGMNGVMDAVFFDKSLKKAVVLELKTGAAYRFSPSLEHRAQLLSYLLLTKEEMFKGDAELEGFLLYCGEKEVFPERRVVLTRKLTKEIMDIRNRLALARISGYRPESRFRWERCFPCSYLPYCKIGRRSLEKGGIFNSSPGL